MRHPDTLRAKSKTHEVRPVDGWTWRVISGNTGTEYTVTQAGVARFSCTCDWAKYRPADGGGACGCSHTLAVIAQIEAERARSTQVYNDLETARKQHRRLLDIGDGLVVTTRAK